MDRPGVRKVPEGSGEQGKMEETGCKIICDAPATLAVKELMMIVLMFSPASFLPSLAATGTLGTFFNIIGYVFSSDERLLLVQAELSRVEHAAVLE